MLFDINIVTLLFMKVSNFSKKTDRMERRMDAYTSFAQVYDLFMDNVPYELWGAYLDKRFKEYGIEDGLLLDLGCGTGKLTRFMEKKGYDMIGIDFSYEMLDVAMSKSTDSILYLLQDMREFELYGTVRGIYSACDCLNYILEDNELLEVFRLVNNYLDPGGIFIFDMNTPYKYQTLLGEYTFAENREEGSFIWENYYDTEEKINEYDLTLYVKSEDGCFERFQETHFQKCYTMSTIKNLIEEAGLEFLAMYDAYTQEPLKEESEKVTFIARECKKERKTM